MDKETKILAIALTVSFIASALLLMLFISLDSGQVASFLGDTVIIDKTTS